MIETLQYIDQILFQWINVGLSNPIFDWLMPILREKFTWFPLYIFIIAFTLINLKRKGVWLIICLIVAAGVADTISSKLIKPTFERTRPCNVVEMEGWVNERIHCGNGYSFTSSHATNHFAVAVFLIFALGAQFKRIKWPLLIWASSIAFAQVYVGVHYPFDVIVGGILGSLIGYAFGNYFRKKSDEWFPTERMLQT